MYTIQVRRQDEYGVTGQETWQWRLVTPNGTPSGYLAKESGEAQKREWAIQAARTALHKLELAERNQKREWETVDD